MRDDELNLPNDPRAELEAEPREATQAEDMQEKAEEKVSGTHKT